MFNRRGFLRFLMAAPVAGLTAAGVLKVAAPTWTPVPLKFTRIMGRMKITPEAMAAIHPSRTAFKTRAQEILKEYYEQRMVEMCRMEEEVLAAFSGVTPMAKTGVREVGVAGELHLR